MSFVNAPRVVLVAIMAASIASVASAGKLTTKLRWQTLPLPPAMPKATSTGYVKLDDAKIFYSIYGKGDPVLLLHGGLGNSEHFAFQLPALVDKFQVIAIDSRGQGRSTNRSKETITYDMMAADVIAVMDALSLQHASIVGWSDGGEVALKLGIAFPDRVDRLFVFGANYNSDGSKPRGSASDTFNTYAVKCRRDYERMSKTGVTFQQMVDSLLPLWRNPTGITRDQLKTIKAPVLMADGDHDEVIVLDQIEEMSKLIPNGHLVVFENASHFALWQAPEDFNKAMVDFLTGASSSAHL
jgi:pimeloyl-ACP methyl ester carboxylesterase